MLFLEQLEGLVSNQLAVFKTCISITKLEARLAGLSVAPLLVSVCLLFIGFISVWLSGMTLLGYSLMLVTDNILITLGSVFIINCFVVGIVYTRLRCNLKNMSFEKTRAFISKAKESHEIEKTGDINTRAPGKDLVDTTSSSQ